MHPSVSDMFTCELSHENMSLTNETDLIVYIFYTKHNNGAKWDDFDAGIDGTFIRFETSMKDR